MGGLSIPRFLTLYLTDHCQFACDHCFLTDQRSLNKNHLSAHHIDAVLKAAHDRKIYMAVISGGDPTLNSHFEHTIRQMKQLKIQPLLGLNPIRYTNAQLSLLKELDIRTIQIGLDDQSPRGIDDGLNIIKYLKSHIEVTVALTITKQNINTAAQRALQLLNNGVRIVRLTFWSPSKHGLAAGLQPPTSEQIEELLARLKDADPRRLHISDYVNINGAWRFSPTNVPKITIRASGHLSLDEYSKPIAHLDAEPEFVEFYIESVNRLIGESYSDLIQSLMGQHLIDSIEFVPRTKINASGMFFGHSGKHHILVADDLSLPEKVFVQLHEMGHVALRHSDPSNDRTVETAINLWALERLEPMVTGRFMNKARHLAKNDAEDALFEHIKTQLFDNTLREAI